MAKLIVVHNHCKYGYRSQAVDVGSVFQYVHCLLQLVRSRSLKFGLYCRLIETDVNPGHTNFNMAYGEQQQSPPEWGLLLFGHWLQESGETTNPLFVGIGR